MILACGPFGISFLAGWAGSGVVPGAFFTFGGGGAGGHHAWGTVVGLGGGGGRFGSTLGVGGTNLWGGGGHGQYLPVGRVTGRKAGITPGFLGGKGGDWGLAEPLGTSGSGGTGSGGIGTAVSAASADTSATSAATAFGSAPLSPSASAALRRRSAGPGLEGMEGPFSCELPLRCLLLRRDKMDPNLSFGSRLYLAQIFL